MSTTKTWKTKAVLAGSTEDIAEKLGKHLKGGEVIELIGDIGSGKTTFVRGLVRGVGSQDKVSSPTFKIHNLYQSPMLSINHFDFYRLGDNVGVVKNELMEVMTDPFSVVVIEWPGTIHSVLPDRHLSIGLKPIGENERELEFKYDASIDYLMKDLIN